MTQRGRFVVRFLGPGARVALPLILLLLVGSAPVRAQDGGNQAGLVVVHGDGRVITRCVRFDEPQISGLTLLQRSGIASSAETGPMGSTICSLNNEGCPVSDCWCECKGSPCAYWIYFQRNPDGSWGYANIGAAMRQISPGDVDGWMWGDTTSMPPAVSFEAICGSAEPAATEPAAPQPAATEALASTAKPPAITAVPTTVVPTMTSTVEAVASLTATVQPDRATPTPWPSRTPAATATSIPATSTAAPLPSPTEPSLAPTGAPSPAPLAPDVEETGKASGYLAFVLVLGVIGGISYLLRHRRKGT